MDERLFIDSEPQVYEPPRLTDAGDFTEVTFGSRDGNRLDAGRPPWIWRY
ncbi:lasso RiPP family leader peptide-containing protein [Streptomyces swartbergensis]|nr:lasso RiPP family leader peptide-containing protein [Streptomyces swartbergensis]